MPEYFPYHIEQKRQLTPTVVGWTLVPVSGQIFSYRPGQFVMVGLYDEQGALKAKKAYSLCTTSNTTPHLEIGFKVHGDFTQAMSRLNPGDRVGIAGPFGIFTLPETVEQGLVFLGGGIGITPLYSMIRAACEKQVTHPITLLYAVRTPGELAFRPELEQLAAAHPNLKLVFFVEDGSNWTGETGRVTGEKLEHYAGPLPEKRFYICGPVPFMSAMIELLKAREVPLEQIKLEKF